MRILLDTNIVIRAAQQNSPQWPEIDKALQQLVDAGFELCLVPQVLYEFWVSATRPTASNGFGLDAETAGMRVEQCLTQFCLLRDERGIFNHWFALVRAYSVTGKVAHDSRLVAAMQRHTLTYLLTINKADFMRFQSIITVTPADVLAGAISSKPSS